ncbi:MAG: hypothetical protein M0Q23_05925 [Syntrophales bacterium]|nr:hypothetical protein [Syntrophales bacterium]MCK9528173.1 hypothetical protein [Syntrophales bacterium]MDX9921143.1 hypothetical protein [Syntrophales bacterium]
MTLQFSFRNLALIAVVSLQVTTVAYIHAPRWKAPILFLPFPFTMRAPGPHQPGRGYRARMDCVPGAAGPADPAPVGRRPPAR